MIVKEIIFFTEAVSDQYLGIDPTTGKRKSS